MYRVHIGIIAAVVAASGYASEVSINDCMLNGLKGVSGDIAASLVRKSCEGKQEEHRRATVAALRQEYGELISRDSVQLSEPVGADVNGLATVAVTNRTNAPGKTLTYAKLVTYANNGAGNCDGSRAPVWHSYKLTLKPGSTAKLIFPSGGPTPCVFIETVRGKPPTWRDISLAGSVKPMPADVLDAYREFDPPAPTPVAAPAPAARSIYDELAHSTPLAAPAASRPKRPSK